MDDTERWRELGQQLRVDSIRCSAVTKSGHPTSSMSAADLMAVLLAKYLHYDFDTPDDPHNDHLVFSKGHASPLLYSMYRAAGAIDEQELLTFRTFGSRLQGHPTPAIPWDSRPTVVVAKTIKGKGVKEVENKPGWHGKALDNPEQAIEELGGVRNIVVDVAKPDRSTEPHRFETGNLELPSWDEGEEVATRRAYGDALVALGSARGDVVALDGEVNNSTYTEIFAEAHPERYFEMYIAEQQLIAAAVGLQVRGWVPFGSSFAAFFSRAY